MHKYISLDYLLGKTDSFPFSYRTVYEHILANAPIKEIDDREVLSVRTNLYDEEEIHKDCTVQIWRNSVTGEESWGWWDNMSTPDSDECELYGDMGD